MNILEQLDAILEYHRKINDRDLHYANLERERQELMDLRLKTTRNDLNKFQELEKYLESEKMISKNEISEKYMITPKGYVFKGYVHTREEELNEKARIKKQEDQIRLLTLLLAIGSIGVLIIEAMKFILDYFM